MARGGRRGAILAVSVLLACGGGGSGGGSAVASGPRTVTGSRFDTYQWTGHEQRVPVDLSTAVVAAHVATPSGAYATIPGTGSVTGAFTIPGVPQGEYLLQVGTRYVRTRASSVALGDWQAGRPDAGRTASPFDVTVDVSGLDPWTPADTLELFSREANSFWSYLEPLQGLPDGATTAQYTTTMISTSGFPAVDPAMGDRLLVTQMHAQGSSTGLGYLAATRLAEVSDVALAGTAGTVSAALAPFARERRLTLDVHAAPFAATLAEVNPAGEFADLSLYVSSYPVPLDRSARAASSDLAIATLDPAAPLEGTTGELRVGSLGAGWNDAVWLGATNVVRYRLPGVTGSAALQQGSFCIRPLGAPAPLDAMRPPVSVRIGELPFFAAASGIGTEPTVSWLPPTSGPAPTRYVLWVYEVALDPVSARVRKDIVASIEAAGSPVRLPPGILRAGGSYAVLLLAEDSPGEPGEAGFAPHSARVASGLVTP